MDDGGIRTKFLYVIGHTIIKTSTHRQNHITIMHGHVSFISAVHTEHTQKLWIRTCKRPQTHQSVGDWQI